MIDKYVMLVDSGEFFSFIEIDPFSGYPFKTTRTPGGFCASRIEENKEYLHRCKVELLKMGIALENVVIRDLETGKDIKVFADDWNVTK
jgi:hypothetical protein